MTFPGASPLGATQCLAWLAAFKAQHGYLRCEFLSRSVIVVYGRGLGDSRQYTKVSCSDSGGNSINSSGITTTVATRCISNRLCVTIFATPSCIP